MRLVARQGSEFCAETTGVRLRFDGIDFGGRSSSTLTAADKAVLAGFAAVFEANPGATHRIESHTDERGTESANLTLTRSRAVAVWDYLAEVVGGPGPYLDAVGVGEGVALDPGSTQVAWDRNDRIEVVVTDPDVPVTRFVLSATRLDAVRDCDANPPSGDLQPGDFYVTVSIRVSNSDGFFVMDEIVDQVVTANDGESFALDIAANAAIRAIEADIVEVHVGFSEYDGSGNFDFRRSVLFQLGYVPELDCWGPWRSDACGVTKSGILGIEEAACEASLEWALRLQAVR